MASQGSATSVYQAKRAAALTNPTSAAVFLQNDNSAKGAFVRVPYDISNLFTSTTGSFNFALRAFGRATTGTTSNFLAKIQYTADVTSLASASTCATAANNTDLVTLTNRSLATVTRTWSINAILMWDFVSKRLTGQWNGVNAETIETASQVVTALTAIDLSLGKSGFVVAGLFGSTNASNACQLDNFVLEVL